MAWQLRDPAFRQAIRSVVEQMSSTCVLAGTVGVQVHMAAILGLDRAGPPAHAIEVVALGGARAPVRAGTVDVVSVDTLGFDGSIEAGRTQIEIAEQRFPVAAPEHILGMLLAAVDLPADARWAAFALMRTLGDRLDLEEVRGFLKRSPVADRQTLLAELAYLAA